MRSHDDIIILLDKQLNVKSNIVEYRKKTNFCAVENVAAVTYEDHGYLL